MRKFTPKTRKPPLPETREVTVFADGDNSPNVAPRTGMKTDTGNGNHSLDISLSQDSPWPETPVRRQRGTFWPAMEASMSTENRKSSSAPTLSGGEPLHAIGSSGELPAEGSRPVILVVDDDPTIRQSLAGLLEDVGYAVIQEASAPDVLETLSREPNVRLVVADVMMPGFMGGLSLTSWMRTNRPGVKAILMSGGPGVRQYLANTDIPFLAKPFDFEELLTLVEEVLHQEA